MRNSAPAFLTALQSLQFEIAAKECTLTNVTPAKNIAHQRLFANAMRIASSNPQPDPIPTTFKPPERFGAPASNTVP
jgi:hypothetical protein